MNQSEIIEAAPDSKTKQPSCYLHIRCYPDDKLRWQRAARRSSMKLTPFVVLVLNDAVRRKLRISPE